jgi:MFS family permease
MTDKQIIRRYYLGTALSNAYFPLGIYIIYFANHLGFGYSKALILFVVSWVFSIIFNSYAGIIADKYGRKKCFVFGTALIAIGLGLSILSRNFYVITCLYALIGIGTAFESESFSSLVAQSLGSGSKKFTTANSYNSSVLFVSRAIASLIGGFVYRNNPVLPFVLYLIAVILSGFTIIGNLEL